MYDTPSAAHTGSTSSAEHLCAHGCAGAALAPVVGVFLFWRRGVSVGRTRTRSRQSALVSPRPLPPRAPAQPALTLSTAARSGAFAPSAPPRPQPPPPLGRQRARQECAHPPRHTSASASETTAARAAMAAFRGASLADLGCLGRHARAVAVERARAASCLFVKGDGFFVRRPAPLFFSTRGAFLGGIARQAPASVLVVISLV